MGGIEGYDRAECSWVVEAGNVKALLMQAGAQLSYILAVQERRPPSDLAPLRSSSHPPAFQLTCNYTKLHGFHVSPTGPLRGP